MGHMYESLISFYEIFALLQRRWSKKSQGLFTITRSKRNLSNVVTIHERFPYFKKVTMKGVEYILFYSLYCSDDEREQVGFYFSEKNAAWLSSVQGSIFIVFNR